MLAVAAENSTTGGEIILVDADSGETIGHVSREADITQLASALDYSNNKVTISGTRLFDMETFIGYSFAGWFSSPQPLDATVAEANKVTSLADAPDTIFAHWINAGYLKTTIAYYSGATNAPRTHTISTVPDDLFQTYGFVLSTADSANNGNLVIGGAIDGLNVLDLPKTTVYASIGVRPFDAQNPKTANDFNGGLGGAYNNGTDGYISHGSVNNIPVGRTIHARAYYITKDGTTVYGDMVQKTIQAGVNDTGLEEAATEPVTPPTVDM